MKMEQRKIILIMQRIIEWLIFVEVILIGISLWHRNIELIRPVYLVNASVETMALVCVSILCFCCGADESFRRTDNTAVYFMGMLMVCGMGLFSDAMCWVLDGVPRFRFWIIFVNTWYYVIGKFMVFFFWRYLIAFLQIDTWFLRHIVKVMRVGMVIAIAADFLNLFYGFYFIIDENGCYHRTGGFIYSQIYLFFAFFSCLVIVIKERKKMSKLEMASVISYMFGPYAVQMMAVKSYGLSLTYPAVYVFILIIYSVLNVQRNRNLEMTERELRLASDIQVNALPGTFPAFPQIKQIDLYASMKPAKEVGGDFYDYFEIDDHRIALVMADVSGKGIPAALFMMVSKTLIKSFALRGALTPAQVLAAVNGVLCENNKADFFVTVWLGFLDWKTGHLVTANAGHEFPMMKGPKGWYSLVRDKHGLPAGSLEDLDEKNYVMTEFDLEPGSKVFVYTDGVAEALNNRSEQFGRERILACLDRHKDCDSRETVEAMWSELQVFAGETPQFDDVTMMQIEYKGSGREEG